MRKNIVIADIISQYNTLNRFIKDIEDAFKEKGFNVVYLDKADGLDKGSIFLILCFNGSLFDEINDQFEHDDIPILSIFVDKPESIVSRILNSPSNSILTFVDKNHIKYFMKYLDFNNISRLLPHGGSVSEKFSKMTGFHNRTIDLLFIGTYLSMDRVKNEFTKIYGEQEYETISELAEYLKTDYHIDFEKYLDATLLTNGIKRKTVAYRDLFIKYHYAYEIYRQYYRNETIKTLLEADLPIVCYGNGWSKSEFVNHKNFEYRGACTIEETLEHITEAKITLNIHPTFKKGSHERLFNAMLNGSVCVSTLTNIYDSLLHDNENIIFYDLNDRSKLISNVNRVLENEDEFNKITSAAIETSHAHFLWKHRVDDLLEMVRQEYE